MDNCQNSNPNSNDQLHNGYIKFYNTEKGYGFVSDGKEDYYFSLHDIKANRLPKPNTSCTYKLVWQQNRKNTKLQIYH